VADLVLTRRNHAKAYYSAGWLRVFVSDEPSLVWLIRRPMLLGIDAIRTANQAMQRIPKAFASRLTGRQA
jgi:hypothetical protein